MPSVALALGSPWPITLCAIPAAAALLLAVSRIRWFCGCSGTSLSLSTRTPSTSIAKWEYWGIQPINDRGKVSVSICPGVAYRIRCLRVGGVCGPHLKAGKGLVRCAVVLVCSAFAVFLLVCSTFAGRFAHA